MQTKTLIEASADVITITRLKRGDVYKRLEDTGYGDGRATQLRFGIVTDVMHNGEDGALVAVELTATYAGLNAERKVFKSGADVALFAATPDEIQAHHDEAMQAAQRKVAEAQTKLREAQILERQVIQVVELIEGHQLTAPATITGTVATPAELERRLDDEVPGVIERSTSGEPEVAPPGGEV